MSEQRLIDANKVETGFDELCQSPYFKNDVNARHGAETLMDLCVRSDSHKPNTIDPETLPIVQQLRAELERVTEERDAAVKDIEQAITIYRDVEGWDILCRFCKGKSCRNGGDCKPEWRVAREVTTNDRTR